MKLKELKCKNRMRKKMIEHVTFKISNLQGWVKEDPPLEKASQDKNPRKEKRHNLITLTISKRNSHSFNFMFSTKEKTSIYMIYWCPNGHRFNKRLTKLTLFKYN